MKESNRQVIPYPQLLSKVQGVLLSHTDCEGIRVDRLDLDPERVDGANWHVEAFRGQADRSNWPACWKMIAGEIELLRERYDVLT